MINLNSKIKNKLGKVTKEKLKYFVRLAEHIILPIDYKTIEDLEIAQQAKLVLDHAIEYDRKIELIIMIEAKI